MALFCRSRRWIASSWSLLMAFLNTRLLRSSLSHSGLIMVAVGLSASKNAAVNELILKIERCATHKYWPICGPGKIVEREWRLRVFDDRVARQPEERHQRCCVSSPFCTPLHGHTDLLHSMMCHFMATSRIARLRIEDRGLECIALAR